MSRALFSMRKLVLVFGAVLVFSAIGVVLLLMGVHGPQALTYLGALLLLPVIALRKLGLPVSIPLLHAGGIGATIVFLALQVGYYYALMLVFQSLSKRQVDPRVNGVR